MPWYAVEALDDAFGATKALLTPLDARQWLRLALVVFFLGNAGGSGPSATAGSPTDGPSVVPSDGPVGVSAGELPFGVDDVLLLVVGVIVAGLAIGLLYALIGSLMEFVFVESLRRQRVRIRQYADQHWDHALRLFAFRVLLGLVVVVPAMALVLAVLSFADGEMQVSVGLVAVFVPLLVIVSVLVALVDLFTTNFVVPVMILENLGVVAAWRRFWPLMTREWQQYGVYVLVRFVLAIAVGVLASVVGGVIGAVLLAPLAIVGVLALPVVGGPMALLSNPVALTLASLVVLAYLVVLTAAVAVAFVPIQTYLRYHALLVLGDTDADLDVIPDLRRELRTQE